jgi:hypothetical protein
MVEGLAVPVIGRRHLLQNKRAADRPKDRVDVTWLEGESPGSPGSGGDEIAR